MQKLWRMFRLFKAKYSFREIGVWYDCRGWKKCRLLSDGTYEYRDMTEEEKIDNVSRTAW
jgi:hypothetical protein